MSINELIKMKDRPTEIDVVTLRFVLALKFSNFFFRH
jgi:hypothetical protein